MFSVRKKLLIPIITLAILVVIFILVRSHLSNKYSYIPSGGSTLCNNQIAIVVKKVANDEVIKKALEELGYTNFQKDIVKPRINIGALKNTEMTKESWEVYFSDEIVSNVYLSKEVHTDGEYFSGSIWLKEGVSELQVNNYIKNKNIENLVRDRASLSKSGISYNLYHVSIPAGGLSPKFQEEIKSISPDIISSYDNTSCTTVD